VRECTWEQYGLSTGGSGTTKIVKRKKLPELGTVVAEDLGNAVGLGEVHHMVDRETTTHSERI
jgi:hypothetical protein